MRVRSYRETSERTHFKHELSGFDRSVTQNSPAHEWPIRNDAPEQIAVSTECGATAYMRPSKQLNPIEF